MVECPPCNAVIDLLRSAFGIIGRQAEVFQMVPGHHLYADESGLDRIPACRNLSEDNMAGIAALMPGQRNAQWFVPSRVPVTASG